MRIIAGKLGGRVFHDPQGHYANPMSEKARGALFNVLGDIEGLSFLDPLAGSGALSFEAVSRGASLAVAIESKRSTFRSLKDSVQELGLGEKVKAINAEAGSWSSNNPGKEFDIVLLDPPYRHLQHSLLERLSQHTRSGGLLVLSWPGKQTAPSFNDFSEASRKRHGDIQLVFYRKNK